MHLIYGPHNGALPCILLHATNRSTLQAKHPLCVWKCSSLSIWGYYKIHKLLGHFYKEI